MDQNIKIKCPFCGAVIRVKQQAGLDKASVTCPVCSKKTPFTQWLPVTPNAAEETELPEALRAWSGAGKAATGGFANAIVGCLIEQSGKRWALHQGVNTVGRKLQSDPQQVDIPVFDYTGERKMSRKHAKIEVARLADGSVKHILYNWQNKNETCVDGNQIESGDRIVLKSGMVIRLTNVDVKFVIEDPDATVI